MPIEFAERIRRIPVYPAADGYSLSGDVAMLASNETPFAPMQAVQDAIARSLGGLNRYPDPTNSALRTRLSDRYGVPANRIAVGNGSCDILLAAGDAVVDLVARGQDADRDVDAGSSSASPAASRMSQEPLPIAMRWTGTS